MQLSTVYEDTKNDRPAPIFTVKIALAVWGEHSEHSKQGKTHSIEHPDRALLNTL